jgi:hypothetical protein
MPTNWGARNFTGTNNILIGSQTLPAPNISFSAWVNFSSITGGNAMIGCDTNSGRYEWRVDSTGITLLNQAIAGVSSTSAVSTGTWVHVGTSYDQTTARFYINGAPAGTPAFSQSIGFGGTYRIGRANAPAEQFLGSLADLAVWSGILTAAEFSALAKGIRPYLIRPSLLFAWWPLDGLQSPEPDLAGVNHINGTVTGTTAAFGPPYALLTPRWPQGLDIVVVTPPVFVLMPQIVT